MLKRPDHKADRWSPYSVELKNAWNPLSTDAYDVMELCLTKHGDNVVLYNNNNDSNNVPAPVAARSKA